MTPMTTVTTRLPPHLVIAVDREALRLGQRRTEFIRDCIKQRVAALKLRPAPAGAGSAFWPQGREHRPREDSTRGQARGRLESEGCKCATLSTRRPPILRNRWIQLRVCG
jgi:predicted transcriptional regulator